MWLYSGRITDKSFVEAVEAYIRKNYVIMNAVQLKVEALPSKGNNKSL